MVGGTAPGPQFKTIWRRHGICALERATMTERSEHQPMLAPACHYRNASGLTWGSGAVDGPKRGKERALSLCVPVTQGLVAWGVSTKHCRVPHARAQLKWTPSLLVGVLMGSAGRFKTPGPDRVAGRTKRGFRGSSRFLPPGEQSTFKLLA